MDRSNASYKMKMLAQVRLQGTMDKRRPLVRVVKGGRSHVPTITGTKSRGDQKGRMRKLTFQARADC
jgi:hypothetical protein